ncbi:autotransporter-associated beta strand repeat-containing protein [Pseudomonas plecoglossicida]
MAGSSLVFVSPADANCVATTTSVMCDAGDPYTSPIGSRSAVDGFNVVLGAGSQLNIGDASGITLGNTGSITLQQGASVRNTGQQSYGSYGAGEAINAMGDGNTISNRGTIRGGASSAIFFANSGALIGHGRNRIDNFGTIIAGANGEALGSYGSVGIDFINRPGSTVVGNLNFQGGNDTVVLGNDSTFSGNLDGGGGTNTLRLDADPGNSDLLAGQVKNFTFINKTGLGTWTLGGQLRPNDRTAQATLAVQAGTLLLGANYSHFTGTTIVDNAGTLMGAGEQFPQNITNNGQVLFDQPTDAVYGGVISGTGRVTKSGSGALALAGNNTYAGGTTLEAGTLALSGTGTLGASTGTTTVLGGALDLGGTTQSQAALNQFGGTVRGGTLTP